MTKMVVYFCHMFKNIGILQGGLVSLMKKIYHFYYDGFKSMKVGKKLWLLIAIKLFILFFIIKLLFFPNVMQTHFKTDEARSAYILDQLTQGE